MPDERAISHLLALPPAGSGLTGMAGPYLLVAGR